MTLDSPENLIAQFRHHVDIHIRYGDIDMLGHVNNAKYLTYLEESRIQYIKDVLGWDGTPNSLNMIVAKTVLEYRLPLFLGDHLRLYTRCARLGNKSFDFEYLFVRTTQTGAEIAATAQAVMVAYDVVAKKSAPLAPEWRVAIEKFDGNSVQ